MKDAASTVQNAAEKRTKSRSKKGGDADIEDGELTLLNDLDEENRLDHDDERPFQSFAVQMQSFKDAQSSMGAQSRDESRKELEDMSQDISRIREKEMALDAENKLL